MMKKKVLVSNIMMLKERERFDKILQDNNFEPIFPEVKQFLTENELLQYAGAIDAMLAGDDQITRNFLSKATPRLKVISKWGTGIDSIDLKAASDLNVKICNSPAAFSDAVSDIALGYIIDLYRGITFIDAEIRAGKWPKPTGFLLRGKVLGIVGYGAIGQAIAKRAIAFGMEVIYYDIKVCNEQQYAKFNELDVLFQSSDVICLSCNLTADNYHLVNKETLNIMKQGVKIINVARGPLVNEQDLIAALKQGKVSNVALDVFETEPLPQNSELFNFPNNIFGSHNANNAFEANEYVHQNTIKNLIDGFRGA